MRRQEEPDTEKDEAERAEEDLKNEELEDEEEELDDEEERIAPQAGEIEHGEKSRHGDADETDDRVAWTEDDSEETDGADRRK